MGDKHKANCKHQNAQYLGAENVCGSGLYTYWYRCRECGREFEGPRPETQPGSAAAGDG